MTLTLRPSKVVFDGTDKHADDPRFGTLVRPWDHQEKMDIGIVGVPFDGGVLASGGRIGAALAPDAIREQLKTYGTATNIVDNSDLRTHIIRDCGNVIVSKGIEITHSRTTTTIKTALETSDVVIVLGGGHDISFATARALSEKHHGNIGGANIDAHFDVRPVLDGEVTSGTPFWRLLEGNYLIGENFFEIGAQGHTNSKSHAEYLMTKGAHIFFLDHLRDKDIGIARMWSFLQDRTTLQKCDALFVSIDMDSIAQAFAPGVSAPSPDGLFPADVLRIAYLAGKNPKVRLFEIMEMNPLYDIDGRTARLAANIVLEFCYGYAQR